ncbi:MAG: hypothetical protein KBI12_05420 [Methanothrix sp.]|nr:hypothetical protein [Methanothrix sp.]HRS84850.1 hypothetical protein [Methanothrix sp.]HRT16973.1 hypothetical protein [Methanothrix sp.]
MMERRALPGQILREDKMRKNILYAKRDCENGKRLARLLERAKLKFEKRDLESNEAISQLKSLGICSITSPVLLMDDNPIRFLDSSCFRTIGDKDLLAMIR